MGREKTKKKSHKIWIFIYIAIVVLLVIFIYALPKIVGIFKDSYTAKYDTISVGTEQECLIVRNEALVTATNSGIVTRQIASQALEPKSTVIVSVSGTSYKSPMNGIISYKYDGLENELTVETMSELTPDILEKVKEKITTQSNTDAAGTGNEADTDTEILKYAVKDCASGTAGLGDVLFKVMDNYKWYIVTWVTYEEAEKYILGKTVTITLSDGSEYTVKVEEKNVNEVNAQLILSCDRYNSNLENMRTDNIKLTSREITGIVLETDSIVEVDGVKGVYIINKVGDEVFRPIKILGTSGTSTIVEKNYFTDSDGNTVATVKNYDVVLRKK